jgi:hypothetical protein
MEIFGGFMVMLWMLGFFLTIIWFILPFVIFSIKGKVDRTALLVEQIDARLQTLEQHLQPSAPPAAESPRTPPGAGPPASPEE